AAPDFVKLVQMLHHLNQAQHRSQDSNGRRKAPGGFKHLRESLFMFLAAVEFHLHHLAQFAGFGAIHGEHERFPHERITNPSQMRIERDDALFAGLLSKAHKRADYLGGVPIGLKKHASQLPAGAQDSGQRKVDADRSQRPAKNNERSSGLQDLREISALEKQSGGYAAQRQK